jgi:hypothetical protein
MRASLAMACALGVGVALAAEPSPAAKKEIEHLLSRLENSGCEFFRNGSWYSSKEARGHLQQKYDYLLKKGMISTAESFVELGATSSSASGKPYQVRCAGDAQPTPSAAWLRAQLDSYRGAAR